MLNGNQIKAIRKRCGLTQADLADRLQVTQPTVCKFEKRGLFGHPIIINDVERRLREMARMARRASSR